jgi:ABC-type uncharacterized transport system ATPase subunit
MHPSTLVLDRPVATTTSEREQQIAKLTKALYQADHQQKFLDLQAEVDTLLSQLQSLQSLNA